MRSPQLVELLVGGTPCQYFSLAGKRAKLDDPRGNFTFEFLALVTRLKPKYPVWKTVSDKLSIDRGEVIQQVVDSLAQIGYICDIDSLDAQHFGVPQRKRRVFVVCVKLDDLLKRRTPISKRIMGELLVQALLATWSGIQPASSQGKLRLACARQSEESDNSSLKKMRLLDALLGRSAVTKLLELWAEILRPSMDGPNVSASASRLRFETPSRESKAGTAGFPLSSTVGASGSRNIYSMAQSAWEGLWAALSKCITSTWISLTTGTQMCCFAEADLSIAQSIVNSPDCSLSQQLSSDYWSLALSSLTLLKGVIDWRFGRARKTLYNWIYTTKLAAEQGLWYVAGRPMVNWEKFARAAGLRGVSRRSWITTTVRDRGARPAPDLVERDFTAAAPNRLWVADITYIPTGAGFLYLAVVLDAFSRRIVGWAMETHLRTELVLNALDMALGQRRPAGVIHHSDQGSQYTSLAFGKRCEQAGVRPSMGSVGDCFDNAMCESFFATLECELLRRRCFKTQVEARIAVFDFIEGWYNPHRRHSALDYLSPINLRTESFSRGSLPQPNTVYPSRVGPPM